ncbi:hypothetical protein HMPREF9244_01079 [Alloscardovia omnicolens F0580]|uniref:Uncharacterized protein n=1 Tax=Alloscardovia omnicolens F0580 TaxID=1321816 RepID=U1SI36_9BIFI|nr:hypothetical protein HMPREF9244_01079 [Alloscardovia omnicolens F0580]
MRVILVGVLFFGFLRQVGVLGWFVKICFALALHDPRMYEDFNRS